LCDKYKWANKNAILWDGIMNTNQCWRGTYGSPFDPLPSVMRIIFYSYYCKGFCGVCLTELFWLWVIASRAICGGFYKII
jgi:hypothetical protein